MKNDDGRESLIVLYFHSIGDPRNVTISPAEPIYYNYNFNDEDKVSSVLVQVDSDSEICMTMSIQNTTVFRFSSNFTMISSTLVNKRFLSFCSVFQCPVFDLERNVQYSGYWQTVSRRGGVTISVSCVF